MSFLLYFRQLAAVNTVPLQRLHANRVVRFVNRSFCLGRMDTEVNFEDLQQHLKNNGVVLIDVRNPEEIVKDGKIEKSINIPLGKVKEALQLDGVEFEKIYKTKKPSSADKIVMHCQLGKRAIMASDIAKELGLNAVPYKGSFLDWVAKGGPVVH